jgi:hypothetical protein
VSRYISEFARDSFEFGERQETDAADPTPTEWHHRANTNMRRYGSAKTNSVSRAVPRTAPARSV